YEHEFNSSRSDRSGRYPSDGPKRDDGRESDRKNYDYKDVDYRSGPGYRRDSRSSRNGGSEERDDNTEDYGYDAKDGNRYHPDGGYHDQDYRGSHSEDVQPSTVIILRNLPLSLTKSELESEMQKVGPPLRDVRLIQNKVTGQSRGFAFVEFIHLQDATRWMEANQHNFTMQGQRVSVDYSHMKPKLAEDWICSTCGYQNFSRRDHCLKCGIPRSSVAQLTVPYPVRSLDDSHFPALGLSPVSPVLHSSQHYLCENLHHFFSGSWKHFPKFSSSVPLTALIIRNLGAQTTVEAIIQALLPYAMLTPTNIRLIKDRMTNYNRGFAFVELGSVLEASQLLQILTTLQPPLRIDNKTVNVDYAKGNKRMDPSESVWEVTTTSVASLAIAAAHWSATQAPHGSDAAWATPEAQQANYALFLNGQHPNYMQYGENSFVVHNLIKQAYGDYSQYYQQAAADPNQIVAAALAIKNASAANAFNVFVAVLGTVAAGIAAQQSAAAQASGAHVAASTAQESTSSVAAAASMAQASTTHATPAVPAPTGTQPYQKYPVPDVSTYQYDESSGYYYDPQIGLYYDSSSQYYYNSQTQEYLYWDSERQTYLPASEEGKDKKDKPKTKTAQQIAKDMEKWAKSLNKQKEFFKNSFQPVGAGGRDDERESASADAGYAMLEKRAALANLEKYRIDMRQLKATAVVPPQADSDATLVASYGGGSDSEEDNSAEAREEKLTDWVKLACLLCRRMFPSKEALLRHQQLSDLHKQNLEQHRRSKMTAAEIEEMEKKEREVKLKAKYRDRAAERREKYGIPEPPEPKKKKVVPEPTIDYEQPTKAGIGGDNIGSKMLQAMGWTEGSGLGKKHQGITLPVEAKKRTQGAGLGARGATYGASAADTYKDQVRRAMMARFNEME
uniref:RNA binding motif protein 5 n=1 Tax=Petromyzon marinus TaxID=7757 RepID=S4RAJ1_PETMA